MKIGIIGGINIDIEGVPFNKIKYQDSNPGTIRISYGGVGRNIAENVARLGGDCAMISVISDEPMSQGAVRELKELGVETSMIRAVKGRTPSLYLSILNENRDMELAVSDMEILDQIDRDFIDSLKDYLEEADVITLDGNLSEDNLSYASEKFSEKKLFYDPVSASKAERARKLVGRFFAIKPNRIEAEVLLDMKIETDEDVEEAARRFMELGVKQVFITLGKQGVYYMEEGDCGFLRPVKELTPASATGAGDGFSACILMGITRGLRAREIAFAGMTASEMALESENAVNRDLSYEELLSRIKEKIK